MATINLPTSAPFKMAVINTQPRQLRAIAKADQEYQLRLVYVPDPPNITSSTQTLYLPDMYRESLYYKFVEKVALAMGNEQLAGIYRVLYDDWLRRNKFLIRMKNKLHQRLRFSWL